MLQLLSRLRSYFIFVPDIFFCTFVMGTISLACSCFDKRGRIQHRIARAWARMILRTSMSPVTAHGLERIDLNKAQVFAANHVSSMDVPVVFSELPVQFRIVAKKELFRYPFLGWHLRRSGQIPIDRTSMKATIKGFFGAAEDLRSVMNVMIFPEGRRSRDGRLQPFFNGAFYLALKAQVPIVPMAIIGTYEMLPMKAFHIKPRRLELRVGEPVPTAGLSMQDLPLLSMRVKDAIEDLCCGVNAESEDASECVKPR